jgi:ABC-type antimicrobial peptide transport system permease subunit
MVDAVRAAVWAVNPDFTVYDIRTMERVIYEEHWESAVYSRTFNTFSAIALILAALGVYGVVAFSVVQRTREFGIRLALGARAGAVVRLAVRQVAFLTSIGLLVGITAAFLLMRLLSGMLFGVEYYDPAIYSLTALAMAAVALIAGYIPARRATRVDPVDALRKE